MLDMRNLENELNKSTGGKPLKWNYLLGGGSFEVQATPTRWVFQEPICTSVPSGVVMRGSVQLQWIFFEDTTWVPISWWVIYLWAQLSTPCWVFGSFWPTVPWPLCPTLSIHQILPQVTFCVSLIEKSPQREMFCWCERDERKMAEALSMHQNRKVHKLFLWTVFELWKNHLGRCITSNGEYFKDDWSLNIRINTQLFINKFWVFGVPPIRTFP